MPVRDVQYLTLPLKKLKRSLDEWRLRRQTPRRIPDEIWEHAVVAAKEHGVGPVAQHLHLDHAKLKSKVTQEGSMDLSTTPTQEPVPAAFFELFPPPSPSRCLDRCVLEVESGRGSRMRVEVCGLEFPGLVTLVREFVS